MFQSENIEQMIGYKCKHHIYAAYKRFTSDLKTYTDWKWEDEKKYSMRMKIKRKLRLQHIYQSEETFINFQLEVNCYTILH